MIERYSTKEMKAIWSEQRKYEQWLAVEIAALAGLVRVGLAPEEALKIVKEKAKFSVERTHEIEEEVKHDVIAFLTNVAEHVGPLSRFIHRGMTSSDVLDTAFALQIREACDQILTRLEEACRVLEKRAKEFKHTPCIGRSHGIHAEPVTFGLKLAGAFAELRRHRTRLLAARASASVGKIAGPVGTYAGIPPEVEASVMAELGLTAETVATQIVARDRHAEVLAALAGLASSIERTAVEIRHLQRTEVGEAREGFSKGQKGSSAMPHKRNPILSENLSGLARLVRSYAQVGFENVPLWHERDISHSAAERVAFPDAFIACDFMLLRFTRLIEGLEVFPEKMRENLELSRGTVFSGHLLLLLTDKGMAREDAYRLVQELALSAWDGGPTLQERACSDDRLRAICSENELAEQFDLDRHLRFVDMIFARTFAS
jgi:adenylosuccinate lyase